MIDLTKYNLVCNTEAIDFIIKEWIPCEFKNEYGYFLPYDERRKVFVFIALNRMIKFLTLPKVKVTNRRLIRMMKTLLKNGIASIEYEDPFPDFKQQIPFKQNDKILKLDF